MHHFPVTFKDPKSGKFSRFIVAEIPYGESLQYVFEKLYNTLPPEERSNSAIIIRPGVKFQLSQSKIKNILEGKIDDLVRTREQYMFLNEIVEDCEQTFQRFNTHSVHILASEDYHHFLTDNINPSAQPVFFAADKAASGELIAEIKNAEIDFLVEQGGCKMPLLGGQYYRAPSGRYMKSFLRVGNLQTSRSAIDSLFFWLLPYLRNCVGIITDTWSISSISQNASRRLVDYSASGKPPCPIEMLGDYHDKSEKYGNDAAETIQRFISRIGPNEGASTGQVLMLISATHTGSMVSLIERFLQLREIPRDGVSFVSIFSLSPAANIPTLRDLSDDDDFAEVNQTLSEEEQKSAVEIHSTLYFPTTVIDVEISLKRDVVRPYGEFATRYANISFARVHRTDQDSNPANARHHAIWIDTPKLVSHPAFQARFEAKLKKLKPRPSIIIHPDHEAARSLAALANKILNPAGTDIETFCHDDLKLLPDLSTVDAGIQNAIENLKNDNAVLLLDDAFVTGTRIAAYQKNLRKISFGGAYYYIAAIARPERKELWKTQERSFLNARAPNLELDKSAKAHNVFDYVELLVLPNWDENQCPWCAECEKSSLMRQNQMVAPLNEVAEGMDNGIFIVPKGHTQLDLKSGSFFGPPGQAQSNVFCAIAGAIQHLRTEKIGATPLLGDRHFLVKPVLNESYYLRYFTDSILIAAILRACTKNELVYSDFRNETRRSRAIREFLLTKTNGDLICEMALAIALEKFPEFQRIDPKMHAKLAVLLG